jgi:hypothetical protein
VYATYFGGTASEGAVDVALDPAGNVYFTGRTLSTDFPTTNGALDRVYSGDNFIAGADAFVVKFAVGPDAPAPPPPLPPPPPPPGTPALLAPADGASAVSPVSFDWTDVADAASYQIQVDDTSGFGEPFLILDEQVTASALSTSALPDSPWFWFWRVRALNSAGGPGPWSEVRMIDVDSTPDPPPPTTTTTTTAPSPTTTTTTTPPPTTTVPPTTTTTTSTTTAPSPTTTTVPPSGPLPGPSLLSPANDARFAPGQTITFDWGDVSGAGSYTIQIDNDDDFPSPLIVNQTVSISRHTASGLPTTRMWWRVRANDGNGAPGAWSSARRFELKD